MSNLKTSLKIKLSREQKITFIPIIVAASLITAGYLSNDRGVAANMIILSIFIAAVPQFLLRYERYKDIREMEDRLPHFLHDLTESIRSGMPFHKAISAASKLEYGALSKEIKKMSYQISWGMPLEKVIEKFSERVKSSRRLYVSAKIIRESYMSGGNVVETLESVADNSTLLRDSEKERKSLLNQYVVLMYAISLIFVVIVVVINNLLVPIFQTVGQAGTTGEFFGLRNPCEDSLGFSSLVCSVYENIAQFVFLINPKSVSAYYTSLFFIMAVIQSTFSGLVAGQISENSVTAGLMHSLILVGITVGSFMLLIRIGFMGV